MSADDRLTLILEALQDMAAGDLERRVTISPQHDELDALGHAVNVVGGELQYTTRHLSRARDEAEQASHAKTLFLRNVSHEIRTPLSAIHGTVELLQATELDRERRRELYERIRRNCRSLIDLIDDLLDLSKVESGKLAIELRPVALSGVAVEVVESLEPEALHKRLELLVDTSQEHAAIADRRRVRQILVNLVGNAIKFTERGRILVRIERRDRVQIDVIDTGIGLEPAQVVRLFEPFAQADRTISSRFGGTGLGLALSRRLARAMGGDVELVETGPGKGSTFRLSLPPVDADPAPIEADGQRLSPPRADLGGVRLLLVDDNEDVRTPVAMLLETRGAVVAEAGGGLEAVEIARRECFDLILMDVRMPDLDGLEATRQLRALGIQAPIIALTADVVLDRHQEYLAAGYSAQFAKPMDIDRLVGMIRELRGKSTR